MTVAVSCNLSEGLILGVDSAITFRYPDKNGDLREKVFENAEKLFQLGEKSIGLAVYGLAILGSRNIGSFIREFEVCDPNKVVSGDASMEEVVEELRKFLYEKYMTIVVPPIENQLNKKFKEFNPDQIPILGLVVGGFSCNEYLSEVWEIKIPTNSREKTSTERRARGKFGTDWYAIYEPIRRYIKGFDPHLLDQVFEKIVQFLGRDITVDEWKEINEIIQSFEYAIPYDPMPLEEGVDHVRFLVELVINHHRFSEGAPVVGGSARIGKVTYKGEKFEILNNND